MRFLLFRFVEDNINHHFLRIGDAVILGQVPE